MPADERVISYIHSLGTDNCTLLEEIYQKARKDRVPVIRRETQDFLKTLLQMVRPERILEIGTAVGFSALLMALHTEETCRIVTLEKNPASAEEAEKNIARAGMGERISVRVGDAADLLKELDGSFDLIFMDAAKAQYMSYLHEAKRLGKKGTVLLADNILQEGDVIESRFLIERRDRTIHKRMREFLYEITHDPELSTSLIPLGDGISLSVVR